MDNIKIISRPKVRFCQFYANARNKEKNIEHCKDQVILRANGPRIKEFVSFKKPIRMVELTKSASAHDQNVSRNRIIDTTTSSHYDITSNNVRNTAFSDKDITNGKNIMILHDTSGIRSTEKSSKMLQFDKSQRDNNVLEDSTNEMTKKKKGIPLKRAISSKNVNDSRMENSQRVQLVAQEKFKLATSDDCIEKVKPIFKEPKITKLRSAPSVMKRSRNLMIQGGVLNAKPTTTLSCVSSRYKTVVKNKISPAKKIVLCDISSPKIKMSMRPVLHKKQNDAKISDMCEECTTTSNVIVKNLTQPKYNSIVSTINKLKELEQQKIVTDINHLPSTLKSYLNGKISTVLDFPLDEAIYKNLVDLNIDERQLPPTIIRSKDPEPRQKDTIPKLSNFFIPEDTKEICEAVHVKSRSSKIDDNWNAFKISDRILEWKYSVHDVD